MDGTVRTVGLKELWTLKWHTEYNKAGNWTVAGGAMRDSWLPNYAWMADFKDY